MGYVSYNMGICSFPDIYIPSTFALGPAALKNCVYISGKLLLHITYVY